jgi:hypothetical protein
MDRPQADLLHPNLIEWEQSAFTAGAAPVGGAIRTLVARLKPLERLGAPPRTQVRTAGATQGPLPPRRRSLPKHVAAYLNDSAELGTPSTQGGLAGTKRKGTCKSLTTWHDPADTLTGRAFSPSQT